MNKYRNKKIIIVLSLIYSLTTIILFLVSLFIDVSSIIIIYKIIGLILSLLIAGTAICYLIFKNKKDLLMLSLAIIYIILVIGLGLSFLISSLTDYHIYYMIPVFIYSLVLLLLTLLFNKKPKKQKQTPQEINQQISQPKIKSYDPQTGEPIYETDEPEIIGYDPHTGKPVYQSDKPEIIGYDPQTGQPIYNNVNEEPVFDDHIVEKKKKFSLSFLKSKKIIITAIIIVCLMAAGAGGFMIYSLFFDQGTTIHLLENMEVTFEGYDGHGYVNKCLLGDVEYDTSNDELKDFIEDVEIEYDENKNLSNGDEIEFYAVYDEEKAKELDLVIKDDVKTVEVQGLIVRYTEASKVPDETYDDIKDLLDASVSSDYDENVSSYRSYTSSFKTMYFIYDEDGFEDYCTGVYEITETSNFTGVEEIDVFYVYAYVYPVNDAFNGDDCNVYHSILYDSYQRVSDEGMILDALKDHYLFDDHSFTEFE